MCIRDIFVFSKCLDRCIFDTIYLEAGFYSVESTAAYSLYIIIYNRPICFWMIESIIAYFCTCWCYIECVRFALRYKNELCHILIIDHTIAVSIVAAVLAVYRYFVKIWCAFKCSVVRNDWTRHKAECRSIALEFDRLDIRTREHWITHIGNACRYLDICVLWIFKSPVLYPFQRCRKAFSSSISRADVKRRLWGIRIKRCMIFIVKSIYAWIIVAAQIGVAWIDEKCTYLSAFKSAHNITEITRKWQRLYLTAVEYACFHLCNVIAAYIRIIWPCSIYILGINNGGHAKVFRWHILCTNIAYDMCSLVAVEDILKISDSNDRWWFDCTYFYVCADVGLESCIYSQSSYHSRRHCRWYDFTQQFSCFFHDFAPFSCIFMR